jgi:hypothetical protein
MVLPLNVYRRSLVRSNNPQKLLALAKGAIRKDSAVHVSLSSYSVVKQPGVQEPLSPWRGAPKQPALASFRRRMTTGNYRLFVHSSQWRAIGGTEPCLSPRANAVPRSVVGLYAHAPFIVNAYRQQIVASHSRCSAAEDSTCVPALTAS